MNADIWIISPEERQTSINIFKTLNPINGKLSGQNARDYFLKSNLPMDVLALIWEKSDMDKDGSLVIIEFIVACKLISLASRSVTIPHVLPSLLLQSANGLLPKVQPLNSSDLFSPQPTFLPSNSQTFDLSGNNQQNINNSISSGKSESYTNLFNKSSSARYTGKISGEEARPIFLRSGLSVDTLGKIWQDTDLDNDGYLSLEEFKKAMNLIELTKTNISSSIQTFSVTSIPKQYTAPTSLFGAKDDYLTKNAEEYLEKQRKATRELLEKEREEAEQWKKQEMEKERILEQNKQICNEIRRLTIDYESKIEKKLGELNYSKNQESWFNSQIASLKTQIKEIDSLSANIEETIAKKREQYKEANSGSRITSQQKNIIHSIQSQNISDPFVNLSLSPKLDLFNPISSGSSIDHKSRNVTSSAFKNTAEDQFLYNNLPSTKAKSLTAFSDQSITEKPKHPVRVKNVVASTENEVNIKTKSNFELKPLNSKSNTPASSKYFTRIKNPLSSKPKKEQKTSQLPEVDSLSKKSPNSASSESKAPIRPARKNIPVTSNTQNKNSFNDFQGVIHENNDFSKAPRAIKPEGHPLPVESASHSLENKNSNLNKWEFASTTISDTNLFIGLDSNLISSTVNLRKNSSLHRDSKRTDKSISTEDDPFSHIRSSLVTNEDLTPDIFRKSSSSDATIGNTPIKSLSVEIQEDNDMTTYDPPITGYAIKPYTSKEVIFGFKVNKELTITFKSGEFYYAELNGIGDWFPCSCAYTSITPMKYDTLPFKLALYDNEIEHPDDIEFHEGDILSIIEDLGDWGKGYANGKLGFFPMNFVTNLINFAIAEKVEVKREYTAKNEYELSVLPNSMVTILHKNSSGWCYGHLQNSTKIGCFHISCIDTSIHEPIIIEKKLGN